MIIKLSDFLKLFTAFYFLLLFSCASEKYEGTVVVPKKYYDLDITYAKEEQAFKFKFFSKSKKDICIPLMKWPNEGGHFFFDDEKIKFDNLDISYYLKKDDNVHCTAQEKNGCIHILRKNEELLGKVPINDFVISQEIYLDKKFSPKLNFPFVPHYCAE